MNVFVNSVISPFSLFCITAENTVNLNLPAEHRKLPSTVFEASIHGVTPIGLKEGDIWKIRTEATLTWSIGAVEKTQQLVEKARSIRFVPIAILRTNTNDVVLGDLFLQLDGKEYVNLIDELSGYLPFHMYLERNKDTYIRNLSTYYCNRSLHRNCANRLTMKPDLSINLPKITTGTTINEYIAICEQSEPYTQDDSGSSSPPSLAYMEIVGIASSRRKLTPAEVIQYSKEYITVHGREYNVLKMIISKAREIDYYGEHNDDVSGRANTRRKK